jgi:hypothetical protein
MAKDFSMVKNKQQIRKTIEEHSEDALYREVWEEVNAQKLYNFILKHIKIIVISSVTLVVLIAGIMMIKHIKNNNALEVAKQYESAMNMDPKIAHEALSRMAKSTSGGMRDLALFRAYQLSLAANDRSEALDKLEKLAKDANSRDFRDLALIQLAEMKGTEMSADAFQKMMSPLLTKRSPFYYTGLLMVAQKYISENKNDMAKPFLKKITSEEKAPATTVTMAEMLLQ